MQWNSAFGCYYRIVFQSHSLISIKRTDFKTNQYFYLSNYKHQSWNE